MISPRKSFSHTYKLFVFPHNLLNHSHIFEKKIFSLYHRASLRKWLYLSLKPHRLLAKIDFWNQILVYLFIAILAMVFFTSCQRSQMKPEGKPFTAHYSSFLKLRLVPFYPPLQFDFFFLEKIQMFFFFTLVLLSVLSFLYFVVFFYIYILAKVTKNLDFLKGYKLLISSILGETNLRNLAHILHFDRNY